MAVMPAVKPARVKGELPCRRRIACGRRWGCHHRGQPIGSGYQHPVTAGYLIIAYIPDNPSSRSHTGEKLDKPFPKLSARSRQTVPREKASFDALSPDQTTGYTRKHGSCSQLAFRRVTSFRSPSKASTRRKAGRRSGRIRHRLDCLGGTELETALPVALAADLAGVFGSVCEPSGLGLTLALPAG